MGSLSFARFRLSGSSGVRAYMATTGPRKRVHATNKGSPYSKIQMVTRSTLRYPRTSEQPSWMPVLLCQNMSETSSKCRVPRSIAPRE